MFQKFTITNTNSYDSSCTDDISIGEFNIPIHLDRQLKLLGCLFIRKASILLKQDEVIAVKAQILLHKFYSKQSLRTHSIIDISMACLFLACKLEEHPKESRHILNVFHYIKYRYQYPESDDTLYKPMDLFGMEYYKGREKLCNDELLLLETIEFQFTLEIAHPLLAIHLKQLKLPIEISGRAWALLNDIYSCGNGDVCLLYEPSVLAYTAIHMSIMGTEYETEAKSNRWWQMFNVDFNSVVNIQLMFADIGLLEYDLPLDLIQLEERISFSCS